MPSTSKKQHNLMAAVANNPAFAKKVGIKQSVGEEFMKADKGRKFGSGGMLKETDSSKNPGLAKLPTEVRNKMGYMKKGGAAHSDVAMDKKVIKKAVGMHDKQLHGGKKTDLAKLAKGGVAKTVTKEMEYDYKTGKKSFPGTTAKRDMHAEKEGKRVAKDLSYDKRMAKMAAGGRIAAKGEHPVQTKSKRGAEMVKMASGGYVRKADGIAKRGLTRGMEPKMMKKGGSC
jgi:hypothetical protein